jgi:squalene-hopene/tetraprenyl-beta-curcumene cyclase
MSRVRKSLSLVVAAGVLAASSRPVPAADSTQLIASAAVPKGMLPVSLANEVRAAVDRGLDWLQAQQQEGGSWSDTNFPALTALPAWAFARATHPKRDAVLDKAVAFLLTCVQEDGGIYREVPGRKGGGLSNYNTAICMTALHATGRPALVPVVQRARAFVAGAQFMGDDVYKGGFGYDRQTGRAYTDLLNTYYTMQAMKLTAGVEDLRDKSQPRADINWTGAVAFVEKMQNAPESGDEAGGFVYNPTDPKAGTVTNASGAIHFRSYGSITYAGMLALIYADVPRDDPRVVSAFDWCARHWSLEENPGMGTDGLFFFFSVLTRSLSACGRDLIPREGAEPVNWKVEVARKLVSLQKVDPATGQGYWENTNGRYWENNPVLVTSYALHALLGL